MFPRRATIALPALIATLMMAASAAAGAVLHHPIEKHLTRISAARADRQKCANAITPATSMSRGAMRASVVCLVNQQRVHHHLPPLRADQDLNRSAQGWTNTMVQTGDFTHGTNFAGRISAAGYDWSSAGENIAAGFQTPWEVVKAWMASPDHCTNILDPTFVDVGTGLSTQHLGQYGPSTWTQDFGLWVGHNSPSNNHGPQNGCPYKI